MSRKMVRCEVKLGYRDTSFKGERPTPYDTTMTLGIQGYFAHKKQPLPRSLPWAHA